MSKNKAPGTAKKGFFRIVFSRTGIILLLILLQAGVFLGMAFYLEEYMTYYLWDSDYLGSHRIDIHHQLRRQSGL